MANDKTMSAANKEKETAEIQSQAAQKQDEAADKQLTAAGEQDYSRATESRHELQSHSKSAPPAPKDPQIENLQRQVDQLLAERATRQRLDALEARNTQETPNEIALRKAAEFEAQRVKEAQRVDHALLDGPVQFTVMHDGDPKAIVGAADHFEAWAKYRKYFGILQTAKEPQIMRHEGPLRESDPIVQRVVPKAEKPKGEVPLSIAP